MNEQNYIEMVLTTAEKQGYPVKMNRAGLRQIDFGHKQLHEEHLKNLYPQILEPNAHIPSAIEAVAPGRPCTHRPMREIINAIRNS